MTLALGGGIAPAQVPQQLLLQLQVALQLLVTRRDLRLRVELLDLEPELEAYVGNAREVLARVGKPRLGFPPPLLVFGDAGGLFQKHAQLLGLRLDDARDHALLDDGVGARAEPGAEEHVGDVAPAHVRAVDVVARLAVALEHALHRDLGILRPLAGGAAERIVEAELHRRSRERRAIHRAIEDHVLHRIAAQRGGAALAQHPAHRVDDVRLAAAVRPHHADELAGDMNRCGIYEGLKTRQLYLS